MFFVCFKNATLRDRTRSLNASCRSEPRALLLGCVRAWRFGDVKFTAGRLKRARKDRRRERGERRTKMCADESEGKERRKRREARAS